MWHDASEKGPEAEQNFCEWKGLSQPTMRITWEAKSQLLGLLSSVGKINYLQFWAKFILLNYTYSS